LGFPLLYFDFLGFAASARLAIGSYEFPFSQAKADLLSDSKIQMFVSNKLVQTLRAGFSCS